MESRNLNSFLLNFLGGMDHRGLFIRKSPTSVNRFTADASIDQLGTNHYISVCVGGGGGGEGARVFVG